MVRWSCLGTDRRVLEEGGGLEPKRSLTKLANSVSCSEFIFATKISGSRTGRGSRGKGGGVPSSYPPGGYSCQPSDCPSPHCEGATKVAKFDTKNTIRCSDKAAYFQRAKSDTVRKVAETAPAVALTGGVALAREGGGGYALGHGGYGRPFGATGRSFHRKALPTGTQRPGPRSPCALPGGRGRPCNTLGPHPYPPPLV